MFDGQFYPTPRNLINKMLDKINFNSIKTVLEPSGGKGDIADAVKERMKSVRGYYNRNLDFDIDTIEINRDLQHILKGKDYRVVHDDFLTYNTFKRYDIILMNPPFNNGDQHLLKAIELQEKGGQIVCILNAETLRNPYSNIRKDLIRKLTEYEAEIEYIEDAFTNAERKTNVEIALIYIDIPKPEYNSTIISTLKQEEQYRAETQNNNSIINADFIKGIVDQYNFEIQAGLKLIAEYQALVPYMLSKLQSDYTNDPILELKLKYNNNSNNTIENEYISQIRSKYWTALFQSKEFVGLFTENLRQKYHERIGELRDYDFSLYNIYSIRAELSKELTKGLEETILDLFEEFSHKHYYDESSKNIHYYNGWKTNKSYKINKKVIIPLNGYSRWSDRLEYLYTVQSKLSDIEKVFNYLDGGITENIELTETLNAAQNKGQTKKIETKYFYVTFYKKGTCHIEFKDMELLHKFNLFGSQRLGWLPPTYGKKVYKDMTKEEKTVIDEFEGSESYAKVMQNKNYYITETMGLLALTS